MFHIFEELYHKNEEQGIQKAIETYNRPLKGVLWILQSSWIRYPEEFIKIHKEFEWMNENEFAWYIQMQTKLKKWTQRSDSMYYIHEISAPITNQKIAIDLDKKDKKSYNSTTYLIWVALSFSTAFKFSETIANSEWEIAWISMMLFAFLVWCIVSSVYMYAISIYFQKTKVFVEDNDFESIFDITANDKLDARRIFDSWVMEEFVQRGKKILWNTQYSLKKHHFNVVVWWKYVCVQFRYTWMTHNKVHQAIHDHFIYTKELYSSLSPILSSKTLETSEVDSKMPNNTSYKTKSISILSPAFSWVFTGVLVVLTTLSRVYWWVSSAIITLWVLIFLWIIIYVVVLFINAFR